MSTRLPIARLAKSLGLDEEACGERVWDWGDEFGLTIDKDILVSGAGQKGEFVAELERSFAEWGERGKSEFSE